MPEQCVVPNIVVDAYRHRSRIADVGAIAIAAVATISTLAAASPCHPSARTLNLEWSGPSLQHGLVGDGSDAACEAWCCADSACVCWSNLLDANCHLEAGQRCCMGWPAGRDLSAVHDSSAQCVSGRIDGKPMPAPWPVRHAHCATFPSNNGIMLVAPFFLL